MPSFVRLEAEVMVIGTDLEPPGSLQLSERCPAPVDAMFYSWNMS